MNDLEIGPSERWLPGGHHQIKMETWQKYLQSIGLSEKAARHVAFQLWKIGQKVDSRT